MSKGSRVRPSKVERKVFEDNWDRIFQKDEENPDSSEPEEDEEDEEE